MKFLCVYDVKTHMLGLKSSSVLRADLDLQLFSPRIWLHNNPCSQENTTLRKQLMPIELCENFIFCKNGKSVSRICLLHDSKLFITVALKDHNQNVKLNHTSCKYLSFLC